MARPTDAELNKWESIAKSSVSPKLAVVQLIKEVRTLRKVERAARHAAKKRSHPMGTPLDVLCEAMREARTSMEELRELLEQLPESEER